MKPIRVVYKKKTQPKTHADLADIIRAGKTYDRADLFTPLERQLLLLFGVETASEKAARIRQAGAY